MRVSRCVGVGCGLCDVRMIMNGAVSGETASQKMAPFLCLGVRFASRERRGGRGEAHTEGG